MLSEGDRERITNVALFGALPPAAFTRLCDLASRVDLDGPTTIFNEGEPAKEMIIVLTGELEVRKRGKSGGDVRIASLRAGEVGGEMSIIDIQPRSASVRSLGPASFIVISHHDLAILYKEDARAYMILVMNIAREISRRLRRIDGLLANLLTDLSGVYSGAVESTGSGTTGGKGS